jgi:squalene-associated FAD-dependent desaturase
VDRRVRVGIVGAGYAGLAAAVELATQDIAVDVFEASRTLGGRARAIDIEGLRVDNGAHILVGAYRETTRLMGMVGARPDALRREPLHLEFPGLFRLRAPRLPAPLHLGWALLTTMGLPLADKIAALRFMRDIQRRRFRLAADTTVALLLAEQPDRLRRHLWEPLCLAALNTPPSEASAQVFLNVLRDSLAADRAASDLLLPTTDLSALLPEPAARYVAAHGGTVRCSCRIEAIRRRDDHYFVDAHGPYEQIILAVAPQHLPRLVQSLPELASVVATVTALRWEPIVACYLAYPAETRLPWVMVGVDGGHAQWLFDRGALCGQRGLIAAVISGHGPHERLDHETLAQRIHEDVGQVLPGVARLAKPLWSQVIADRRATFACTPDLRRPATTTPLPGLWLAGDYVAGDYPATIEGAVRSGVAAAHSVRQQAPRRQT